VENPAIERFWEGWKNELSLFHFICVWVGGGGGGGGIDLVAQANFLIKWS
jgi:hypothetical protein